MRERERVCGAVQAQLADLSDLWNLNAAEAEMRVEPEPAADSTFKFENMAAAVVTSSRDTLYWTAPQETPILTVDDVEAGPDFAEICPQVYVALAELLEEKRRTLYRTPHEAEAGKRGGNS